MSHRGEKALVHVHSFRLPFFFFFFFDGSNIALTCCRQSTVAYTHSLVSFFWFSHGISHHRALTASSIWVAWDTSASFWSFSLIVLSFSFGFNWNTAKLYRHSTFLYMCINQIWEKKVTYWIEWTRVSAFSNRTIFVAWWRWSNTNGGKGVIKKKQTDTYFLTPLVVLSVAHKSPIESSYNFVTWGILNSLRNRSRKMKNSMLRRSESKKGGRSMRPMKKMKSEMNWS